MVDEQQPEHPAISQCKCGGVPFINWPCYADETVSIVCPECDAISEGFMMGPYREGATLAIQSWNEEQST